MPESQKETLDRLQRELSELQEGLHQKAISDIDGHNWMMVDLGREKEAYQNLLNSISSNAREFSLGIGESGGANFLTWSRNLLIAATITLALISLAVPIAPLVLGVMGGLAALLLVVTATVYSAKRAANEDCLEGIDGSIKSLREKFVEAGVVFSVQVKPQPSSRLANGNGTFRKGSLGIEMSSVASCSSDGLEEEERSSPHGPHSPLSG